jgi:hypothetical protein
MASLDPVLAPVYVSAFMPDERHRQVRVVRHDGVVIPEPCASQEQFEALVEQHRPGTDLADPLQVYWADRPGVWSGI